MPSFIDEYLLRLGATVDAVGIGKFQSALREISSDVERTIGALSKRVLGVEAALVGAFAAVGSAAVGLVDNVAMADQEFRLFGLHMYMGKNQARDLKVAMDALGQPLENLMWDPELRGRAATLIQDQRAMAAGRDFDAQMRKVRDIRFEFTRMEVELKYLGMHVVTDFLRALGLGPDTLLKKLRQFNDWVVNSLPRISKTLVRDFLPVWRDIEKIMKDVWQVGVDFAQVFTNIIGLLAGDETLQGAVSFDKLARAIADVAHWIAVAADLLVKFTGLLTGAVGGGTVGGMLGTIIGGVAGVAGGPAGMLAGAVGGGAAGTTIGAVSGGVLGGLFDAYRAGHPAGMRVPGGSSADLAAEAKGAAQQVSAATGVPADIIWAQWAHETGGFTHLGAANNLAGINVPGGSGTDYRAFGSLGEFAAYYAANLKRNYPDALSATDPTQFARALKHGRLGAYYSDNPAVYAAGLERYDRAYKSGATIGSVNVNVSVGRSNASAEHIAAVVADRTGKQVQRNLDEFQAQAWSY